MYVLVNFVFSYRHGIQNELNKIQFINMADHTEDKSKRIKVTESFWTQC
jgi:hypothetical protein